MARAMTKAIPKRDPRVDPIVGDEVVVLRADGSKQHRRIKEMQVPGSPHDITITWEVLNQVKKTKTVPGSWKTSPDRWRKTTAGGDVIRPGDGSPVIVHDMDFYIDEHDAHIQYRIVTLAGDDDDGEDHGSGNEYGSYGHGLSSSGERLATRDDGSDYLFFWEVHASVEDWMFGTWKNIILGAEGLPLEVGVPFFEESTPGYDNWTVVVWNNNEILAWDTHQNNGPHSWGEHRESLCIDLAQWRGMGHGLALIADHYDRPHLYRAFAEAGYGGGKGAHYGLLWRHMRRISTDEDRTVVARVLVAVKQAQEEALARKSA